MTEERKEQEEKTEERIGTIEEREDVSMREGGQGDQREGIGIELEGRVYCTVHCTLAND